MHMADLLLSPAVATGMYAMSAAGTAVSINKIRKSEDTIKIPEMGVMGAFVFASQMVNFTIPGTGASGHICGGVLLSAMLGPYCGFISMIGILLIQCLFFADGGLMALGGNIWNMAFYGCFVGGAVIWRLFAKNGLSKKKITIASIIACIVSLQLGAFSVTLETLISGITSLPFSVFVSAMLPIHLVIGLVEGIITAAVLVFVYNSNPSLIWTGHKNVNDGNSTEGAHAGRIRREYTSVVIILAVTAFVIASGVSLLASENPDGLEWSIKQVTGSEEIEGEIVEGSMIESAESIQSNLSILPDYGFKNSDSSLGTSVSGIVGAIITVVFIAAVCGIINIVKLRKYHEKN